MRKWLDKAWAKAAAFVLTLVLGGLTVLGGIGIGILVSYNVFLDDGAYLRQTLYQEQCYDSLSMANDYLCAQLDSVGLLDRSYYFVNDEAYTAVEYPGCLPMHSPGSSPPAGLSYPIRTLARHIWPTLI